MPRRGPLERLRSLPDRVGTVAAWSAAHPLPATAVALGIVLVLGAGLPGLDRSPDPAEAVPRETSEAEASDAVTTHFKSTVLQKATVQFRVDPDACREDSLRNLPQRHGPGGSPGPGVDCGNVTDEVYLRAMEEFFRYLRDHHPTTGERGGVVTYMMAPSTFYKLANWTVAGGADDAPDGAFRLPSPEDRSRWRTVEEATRRSLADAVAPTVNEDRTAASAVLVVEAQDPRSTPEIGRDVLQSRDEYVDWAAREGNYTVFTGSNPPLVAADPPAESARTSAVLEEDLATAAPLALAAAAAVLLVAAPRPRAAMAGLGATGGTALAGLGAAGWAGASLSPYLLGMVPVALGLGLDPALRLAAPRSEDGGWAGIAGAAAPRTAVTTGAVAAGAAVWTASPAPLVAGPGLVALAAALVGPALALLLVPALAGDPTARGWSVVEAGLRPRPGRVRTLAGVGLAAALVVAATPGLVAATTAPPQPAVRNLPDDDPFRREHEASVAGFLGEDGLDRRYRSHIVVVRGDVLDPETHRYLDAVWTAIREEARDDPALDASTSRHLPFLVRKWNEVGDGPESVAQHRLTEAASGGDDGDDYPGSRQEVQAAVDGIFASPMATFGSLLVDHPRDNITVVPVLAATGDLGDLRASRSALDEALHRAEPRKPDDVKVDVAGPGTTMLLLHDRQTPWLAGMGLAALAVGVPAAAGLRGRRAAWHAGLVPLLAGLGGLAAAGLLGVPVTPALAAAVVVAAATAGWTQGDRGPWSPVAAGLAFGAPTAPFALVGYQGLAAASAVAAATALVGGLAGAALLAWATGTASQG